MSTSLPPRLERIVDLFGSAPAELRLQALLEYAGRLPSLPPSLADHPELLEEVHECQTPFFLATELDEEGKVVLHFEVPPQSPTTRGYAGILHEGLSGSYPDEVLGVPDDFYVRMGLTELISPLRIRGMGAILYRLKRRIRDSVRT